ncbi:MAG TPA: UDP-N-acetylmuramate dehydrogenase [Patescibacteria group bacterium]
MTNLQQQLKDHFPGFNFKYDFPLASLTYSKIGGPAEVYIELKDRRKIIELVKFCRHNQIKLTILGGASNVIVADEGIDGVTLSLANDEVKVTSEIIDDKEVIEVGAGVKTALLVRQTVDLGYTGLEYFLGVPGKLAGAIYNNAHYLQDLVGEHVTAVEVITVKGETRWLSQAECEFSYDYSRFHHTQEVILTVRFALAKGNKEESLAKIKEATLYRAQTQPLGMPSSGCIFQNTPNNDHLRQLFPQFAERSHVPGGFLIDQAGLKGEREGDLEVSHKHAAFFVNHGHGTAADLQKLITKVKQRVKDKFGVELEEEVFYLS